MFSKNSKSDFFPKLDRGYWADLNTVDEQLRLLAHIHEASWAASVFNKRTKEWIAKLNMAKNADDAKGKAEHIAHKSVSGTHEIEWHRVGAHT